MVTDQSISKLTIEGGVPLMGTVSASGAKNAALPILAASILAKGYTEIHNVPYLMDTILMIKMLNALGVRAEYHKPNTVKIWNQKSIKPMAPYDLVTSMRASFFVAGPILGRTGFAKVPMPGGCAIGTRPIDLHLKGFKELGVTIALEHGFVDMQAKSLKGARIYLDFPSVGATENLVMAACLADGQTVIENAAQEPEIDDLCHFLNACGAEVSGIGTNCITVEGVKEMEGASYTIIPDRIEVGTLLIAGAMTKGDVTVTHAEPSHVEPLIQKLREAGVDIEVEADQIRATRPGGLTAIDIETLPFPGFPTDMQAQMMALLTIASGTSVVKETIFENRFMHANELKRMGANIKVDNHSAIVTGVDQLAGAEVRITDLRAGAALVLAGLTADGYTTVYGLKHLKRGYENLTHKIMSLGAKVEEG